MRAEKQIQINQNLAQPLTTGLKNHLNSTNTSSSVNLLTTAKYNRKKIFFNCFKKLFVKLFFNCQTRFLMKENKAKYI